MQRKGETVLFCGDCESFLAFSVEAFEIADIALSLSDSRLPDLERVGKMCSVLKLILILGEVIILPQ